MVGRWSVAAIEGLLLAACSILFPEVLVSAWRKLKTWKAMLFKHPKSALRAVWLSFWGSWLAVGTASTIMYGFALVPSFTGFGLSKCLFIAANLLLFVRCCIAEELHGVKASRKATGERVSIVAIVLVFLGAVSIIECGMVSNAEEGTPATWHNIWAASLFWKPHTVAKVQPSAPPVLTGSSPPAGFIMFLGQVINGFAPMLQENQTDTSLDNVRLQVTQVLPSKDAPNNDSEWLNGVVLWQKQIEIGTCRAKLSTDLPERFPISGDEWQTFDIWLLTRFQMYREIIKLTKKDNGYAAELNFYLAGKVLYTQNMDVGIAAFASRTAPPNFSLPRIEVSAFDLSLPSQTPNGFLLATLHYGNAGKAPIVARTHGFIMWTGPSKMTMDEQENGIKRARTMADSAKTSHNEMNVGDMHHAIQTDDSVYFTKSSGDEAAFLGGQFYVFAFAVFKYADANTKPGTIGITEWCGWMSGNMKYYHDCDVPSKTHIESGDLH
jgi:hypothetical protein